jgi:hypothetical protein
MLLTWWGLKSIGLGPVMCSAPPNMELSFQHARLTTKVKTAETSSIAEGRDSLAECCARSRAYIGHCVLSSASSSLASAAVSSLLNAGRISSMQPGPCWEANSHSASQQIPCLLRNMAVYYRVYNSLLLSPPPRARCVKSTSSHTIFLTSIQILSSHPRLDLLSGLFPSGFPTKIPC